MDLHAAFVIGYLFASVASGTNIGASAIIVHVIRSLTLALSFRYNLPHQKRRC